MATTETARPVKLQVNTTGAWRDVMTFDCANDAEVMDLAARLFLQGDHSDRVRLRIIMPGDTAPLIDWSKAQGWKEWDFKVAQVRAKAAA